jgi:hypothetical protein
LAVYSDTTVKRNGEQDGGRQGHRARRGHAAVDARLIDKRTSDETRLAFWASFQRVRFPPAEGSSHCCGHIQQRAYLVESLEVTVPRRRASVML